MEKLLKRIRGFVQGDFTLYWKAPDRKSLGQQLHELTMLYRMYGFLPYQYLKHGLYLRSFQGDVGRFLPPELIHRFRDSINPREFWVNAIDKRQFADIMARANLPVVPTLASITRQRRIATLKCKECSFDHLLSWLMESGHTEIFLKPATSGSGKGAFRATVRQQDLLIDGQEINQEALFALLFPDDRWSSYLAQPLIIQHPLLHSMNPGSVNTVRIDTLIVGDDIFHNGAYLRTGSGSSPVDSSSQGGIIWGIDLETGNLASVGMTWVDFGRRPFRTHPVTGFRFEGATVPFWGEVKQLVCSAARAMLPLRSLGWDVAITGLGPVLIETNHDYGMAHIQEVAKGLRDAPMGRQTIAALRRSGKLPECQA